MPKMVGERNGGIVFEGTLGRQYDLPYGVELKPREGSNGRTGGAIGGTARDDDGTICLKWATKPQSRIAFESLEKDYDLSPFIVTGEARPPALDERGPRASSVGADLAAVEPTTDAALMLFRGTRIGMRGAPGAEELCLTDMWRANGADPAKRPVNWLGSKQARDLRVFLAESQGVENSDSLVSAENGDPRAGIGGSTWAHWQLAFAYAKYLSPAFHAWVNQAAREKMTGRSAAPPEENQAMLLALRILGREGLELRAAVGAAEETAARAAADAAEAKDAAHAARAVAEEARDVARAAAEPPPPGHRVRRDGAEVYGGPVPGSMAAVQCAAAQGMPERSTARSHWVLLAIATGAVNDATACVLDQKHRSDGRRFMPKALEYTKPAAGAYLRRLRALGFDVVNGLVVQVRDSGVSLRAATADALHTATTRASADPQQSIPGCENDTQPKAS